MTTTAGFISNKRNRKSSIEQQWKQTIDMITLSNDKVWQKFCEFFREEKGYADWTDNEIDLSRNDDDIDEFIVWLVNRISP